MTFLSLAGAPPAEISVNELFSFTPNTVGGVSAAYAYSITGKPAWLSFDPATGALEGRPTTADVGHYPGIAIEVTDGRNTARMDPFDLAVVVRGSQTVTISWHPPTTNEDGSPLTDLSGFEIRYGQRSGAYTHAVDVNDPAAAHYVVDGLAPGSYFFTLVARNDEDVGSELAPEMGIVLP